MDGSWMPLPTRPQRYCDPASLVPFLNSEFVLVELVLLLQVFLVLHIIRISKAANRAQVQQQTV